MSQSSKKNTTGEEPFSVVYNHEFFDSLIYPAGVASPKGIIEYANKPFVDIFGLEKNLENFNWPAFFTTDCKKIVARAFINALNGAFTSSAVELKSADILDQESQPVEILMQPVISNGLVSSVLIFIRNSERLSSSNIYSVSNTRDDYRDFHYFEFSPLPLIRFNKNMNVYMCSRSFEGVVGYKCEEISSPHMEVIKSLFKYDAERVKNYISEIIENNIPFKRLGEIKIRTKSDDERVVNIIIYPVFIDNEIIAIDLLMEDITMLKDLKYRLSIAKRINFLSDIGRGFIHSINNTTNVILNQTQLLQIITEKKTVLDGLKQVEKYVHDVIEHIRRMQDFLDERGDGEVEKEESLAKVINDSVEFVKIHFKMQESRKRRAVSLERNYDNNLTIKTDTRFLRELIIWGVLRVAAYVDKKGTISIDLVKKEFYSLSISVEKNSGLDKENIIPFTIDGYSTSDIRNAAEKINIKIMEEESGELYSIKIIFPKNLIIEDEVSPGIKGEYRVEDRDILIVEDEKALQLILGNLFERMGNRVFVTDNGSNAFEEFKNKNYDIVLTDYDVAGLTGIELAARVKEINEDTTTVLLSGWSLDAVKGYDRLIDFYIAKPFNIDDLLKGISSVISAKKNIN